MLWTILVILLLMWALGLGFGVAGGLIHILLVVAVVVFVISLLQGRAPSNTARGSRRGLIRAGRLSHSWTPLARTTDDMREDGPSDEERRLQTHLHAQLGARGRRLRVVCRNEGIVLQGDALTYHVKQLAQQSVMAITDLPILANEIEVRSPDR